MPKGICFIFAPGAGCTGNCKLVQPGDELIFNSTWEWDQWQLSESHINVQDADRGLFSTCPDVGLPSGHEFMPPLSNDALADLSHKNFSPETMKKVKWVRKMYRDWHEYRHRLGLEYIVCDLEDKASISGESLKFALCRFIIEVKKLDGSDYPGCTLYNILICVQFHLECLGFSFRVISDDTSRDVKFTLDNLMKHHTATGIGISVRKAQVLSSTNEDYLWSLEYLGINTPDKLLNTVVFCIGKGFTLCAGQEHRALRGLGFNSQLTFMRDSDGEIFLRYTEHIGLKINKCGLHHCKVEAKTVDLFATDRPDRCPLCIFIRYLSLLPKVKNSPSFYLQPRKKFFGKSWFVNYPAGVNRLCNVVRDMCKSAGLPGFNTNHSLRAGAAMKMYQSDINEQLIQDITGHRSLAVHSYNRISERQRRMTSKCIFS